MAFFLESTFVGLFFFGWDRLGKVQHLLVTFLVALGSNLSALWILIANAWMQNPVGAEFNFDTMRMELTSFADLLFNPVARAEVRAHGGGRLRRGVDVRARHLVVVPAAAGATRRSRVRSFAVAAGFGLASALSVIVLGDESGYTTGEVQKVKLAAIEAEWETAEAAGVVHRRSAFPTRRRRRRTSRSRSPGCIGLIATRSVDTPVTGIKDLKQEHEARIRNGMKAYAALQRLQVRRPIARGEGASSTG